MVCVFLGGGTTTAAFQWGFGSLPVDLHASELLLRIRLMMAQHLSLIVLAAILSLFLVLGVIYARCVLRFVLIDAVIKQGVVGAQWRSLELLGRSYFLWLVGVVGAVAATVCGVMAATFRLANLLRGAGCPWWVSSLVLVAELVAVVLLGLLVAVVITLTDDLVSPVMYANRSSLPAAWRIVGKAARGDSATFLFYVVLRFAVSTAIGIAVLFVLFPVLMALSSTALLTMALGTFALHATGLIWSWNAFTLGVGAFALGLLTALVFALLSVVGMPGQVYLQNYGVSFIAARVESLGSLCRNLGA